MTRAFADDSISRAGAVALLLQSDSAGMQRVSWYASHMPPMPLYKDTDQTQWYAPYLETAFEQGLIVGNSTATFRPADALTQEEAAALAARFHEAHDSNAGVVLTVPSKSSTNWMVASITSAASYGVKLPFPVRPGSAMSRSDFAAMLQSMGIQNPPTQVAVFPIANADKLAQSRTLVASTLPPTAHVHLTPLRPGTVASAGAPRVMVSAAPVATSSKAFAISMPSLGITDLAITHPSDPSTSKGLLAVLQYGVGHLFSYPGQGGKILIYGHSSSYPWDVSKYTKIFRQINKLSVGDKLYVTYGGNLYTYQVTSKQAVPAKDMSAYSQEGREELILYTCWPPDSISQRYLVHASPVETVAKN
jgi:LPXTG-site transpeptidase (sortase) family protein